MSEHGQAQALRELAASTEYKSSEQQPYFGQVDGNSAATDGRLLVAVEGAVEGIDAPPFPGMVKLARQLSELPHDGRSVSLDALKGWASTLAPVCGTCKGEGFVNTCDTCDGQGYVECECIDCGDDHEKECRACDGDGSFRCEADGCPGKLAKERNYGALFGVHLDRALLAKGLAFLEGQQVAFAANPFGATLNGIDGGTTHCAIFGAGARMLLMGVRYLPEPLATFVEPLDVVGVGSGSEGKEIA